MIVRQLIKISKRVLPCDGTNFRPHAEEQFEIQTLLTTVTTVTATTTITTNTITTITTTTITTTLFSPCHPRHRLLAWMGSVR